MPDVIEAPAPETVTPPPAATPEPEATSIADHAETFGPQREREPANTGQFAEKPADARHKAQSQRATPEDVAEINRLTKELRELEQRVGDKDPDAKVSPRVRNLKRQLAALKALDTPPAPPPVAAPPVREPAADTPSAFTDKEPKIEDFNDQPDPYAAYVRALARYDRKKEAFEAQQAQVSAQHETQRLEVKAKLQASVKAFLATKPDFYDVTREFLSREYPPVFTEALLADVEHGPASVYYLAQHPELVDELFLLTDGKQVTDAAVAAVQRRVRQHVQAASTGSAAVAKPIVSPPRPPNPVRTGPIKTTDDPPAEATSIAEHARYHGPKAR